MRVRTEHQWRVMEELPRQLLEQLLRRGYTEEAARSEAASTRDVEPQPGQSALTMPTPDTLADLLAAVPARQALGVLRAH
jgi:hypothetical protein